MKRSLVLVLLAASVVPARAATPLPCTKHITALGPWTTQRSVTVLNDHDDVDGFFCSIEGIPAGTTVRARVVGNGSGAPYSLALNFHAATKCGPRAARCWRGGCGATLLGSLVDDGDPTCDIPSFPSDPPVTVEVSGIYGAGLDVEVSVT